MEISFDANITAKELFKFSINNAYRKFTGIIWILFSGLVIFVTVNTWGKVDISRSVLLIFLACIYTVVNPVILFMRSKAQVKRNESFQKPLHYFIDENGITISQDEREDKVKWNQMWKAVRYGNLVVVYVSTVRAFILPIKDIGYKFDTLVELLNAGLKTHNYVRRKA